MKARPSIFCISIGTLIWLALISTFMALPAYGEPQPTLTDYLDRLHEAQQTLKQSKSSADWKVAKETVAQAFPDQESIIFPDGQKRNLSLPFKEHLLPTKIHPQTVRADQEQRGLLVALELYIRELELGSRIKPLTHQEQRKLKEQTEEILRSPEFSGYQETLWLQKLKEKLAEWLAKLLGGLIPKESLKALGYFAYGFMVLLIAFILYFVIKSLIPLFASRPPVKAGKIKPFTREEDFRDEDWGARALSLAESGDFRGAARACYLGILQALEQERLLRYNRSKTNWEYLAELGSWPKLATPMRELTLSFDYVWYGHRALGMEEYQKFNQGCLAVKESVKGIKIGSRQ